MIKRFHVKRALAWFFDRVHLNAVMHRQQVRRWWPFIRAVYYHDVPPSEARNFEWQLSYIARHFSPVGYDELMQLHNGTWKREKPGLILSFDDGHRTCREVVAPILEKYGFPGWFFVPAGLVDTPIEEQSQEAARHRVAPKAFDYGSPRVFLTWNDVRELDRGHVVGCHTYSHCRLGPGLSEQLLRREIVTAKHLLEEKLHHDVPAFAWVGGEETSYSRRAAELLREAGYKTVFLTNNAVIRPGTDLHFLNRTHLDSGFPPDMVRFQLSGFLDAAYAPKRRRVAALVAGHRALAPGTA